MIAAIADTHAAIWYVFSDVRLGNGASGFIEATIADGNQIGVSAVSLAEMVYLMEKGRIATNALHDLLEAMRRPKAVLRNVSLDEKIVIKMQEVSRQDIPDFPDRLIAATAQFYGVPLLSRDGRIKSSTVHTIW